MRGYDVTAAHVHDSQCFERLLHGRNSDPTVYADSACRSDEHERLLKRQPFTNCVHHRVWKDQTLTPRQQKENCARLRVEHVFGHQVKLMRQTPVRGIGLARIGTRIALANLVYNMSQLAQRNR
ncbi:MAG: transposase [Acidiferrobacterales bacterium]